MAIRKQPLSYGVASWTLSTTRDRLQGKVYAPGKLSAKVLRECDKTLHVPKQSSLRKGNMSA